MAQQRQKPAYLESPESELLWQTTTKRAGDFLASGRQFAEKHPYQVLLGAASIAGLSALTIYLFKKRHH